MQLIVLSAHAAVDLSSASIQALYHLNGDSNASGKGHNGTDYNVTYVNGLLDQSASTTASQNGIVTSNFFSPGTGDFSIGGWFKMFKCSNGYCHLISKTPGTDVADVMLRQHVGSNLEAEVNGVGTAVNQTGNITTTAKSVLGAYV